MISVLLGLLAGLCWSVHDLVARAFAERLGPFRMALMVLLLGAAFLVPVIVWNGTLLQADRSSLSMALLLGVFYAFALSALFKAFSLAPVSVVGPLTSAYPALVVLWGLFIGIHPSLLQWLAVIAILAGAIIIGRFGPDDGGFAVVAKDKIWIVLVSSAVAVTCFSTSIVLGQSATERLGEIETTFVSRFPAALLVFAMVRVSEGAGPAIPVRGMWKAVAAMALCDVVAVTSVNATGYFPNKELGTMGISAYGALSVLWARLFLKEKVSATQWFGILLISGGVATLGLT